MKTLALLSLLWCALLQNPASGVDAASIDARGSFEFVGSEIEGIAGNQVNFVGDVNADGFDDFFVAAPGELKSFIDDFPIPLELPRGRSYLYYGQAEERFSMSQRLSESADAVFEGPSDSILTGQTSGVGDVNGDGIGDFMISNSRNGALHLFYGQSGADAASGTVSLDDADAIFTGDVVTITNDHLASHGDVNGDGISDIFLSDRTGGRLIYGRSGGNQFSGTQALATVANATFISTESLAELGFSTAILPDANGDGLADLVLNGRNDLPDPARPNGIDPNSRRGEAFLFYGEGGSAELSGIIDVSTADVKFQTSRENSSELTVASAGDLNGDGLTELLLADQHKLTRNGQTYLFYGVDGGITDPLIKVELESDATISGESRFMDSGNAIVGGGDVNGDGYDDFVVGASLTKEYFLFLGGEGEDLVLGDLSTIDADIRIDGRHLSGSKPLLSVSLGDGDGDGRADFLFGDPSVERDGVRSVGAAYLINARNIIPEPNSLMLVGSCLAMLSVTLWNRSGLPTFLVGRHRNVESG